MKTKETPKGYKHIGPYAISDYEHEGDLDAEKSYVLSEHPDAINIHAWEEEDYEAESEYKDEYGELDEPIYKGYIEYDIPEKQS